MRHLSCVIIPLLLSVTATQSIGEDILDAVLSNTDVNYLYFEDLKFGDSTPVRNFDSLKDQMDHRSVKSRRQYLCRNGWVYDVQKKMCVFKLFYSTYLLPIFALPMCPKGEVFIEKYNKCVDFEEVGEYE